jgi:hypothetical protein
MEGISEARRQELVAKIQEFCLFDDDFMSKVFEDDKEATELLLRIILKRNDLTVTESKGQVSVKNLRGRSVRLDIKAVDKFGKLYNIEVQRADDGACEKRARYYSAVLDTNFLLPRMDFEELPETYVIFITEHDVLGRGLPLYTIERTIQEADMIFEDKAHIIYVNGENKDDTELGRLMQDFACKIPENMNYELLSERTKYYKRNDMGVTKMCKIMEDIKQEGIKEGIKEGQQKGRLSAYIEMIKAGLLSVKDAAIKLGISEEELQSKLN